MKNKIMGHIGYLIFMLVLTSSVYAIFGFDSWFLWSVGVSVGATISRAAIQGIWEMRRGRK